MENWVIPLLGGLGIGSVLTAIVTKLIDHVITRKVSKQSLLYKEKRDAYLGLLDALHKAALHPNDENSKNFALWQTRVQLFGSKDAAEATQGIVETNGPQNRKERDAYFQKLIEAIRHDLRENS